MHSTKEPKPSDDSPRVDPKTITDTTQLPDDGLAALQSLVDPEILNEIDERFLNSWANQDLTKLVDPITRKELKEGDDDTNALVVSNSPRLMEHVGYRHERQIDALLENLPSWAIDYCWRWSYSLEKTHTPRWLVEVLTGPAETIGQVCGALTTRVAAPRIHRAMKEKNLLPLIKHGELLPEHESRLQTACDDFRDLIAKKKQPTVYSDGQLGKPPEWMLLWGDRESEAHFEDTATMVASKIGLKMADAPARDGQFLWLDFVSQEPDNGYSLSYEIEEWRDQEPIVTLEGQFTKTGVVELSLRVARRLHYEVMGLPDTQVGGGLETEPLRRAVDDLTKAVMESRPEIVLIPAQEPPTEQAHTDTVATATDAAPSTMDETEQKKAERKGRPADPKVTKRRELVQKHMNSKSDFKIKEKVLPLIEDFKKSDVPVPPKEGEQKSSLNWDNLIDPFTPDHRVWDVLKRDLNRRRSGVSSGT